MAVTRTNFNLRPVPDNSSMQIRRLLATASLVALATTPAFAQDDPPPPWEFSTELGFVDVSGNTSVTTINVGERVIHRLGSWLLSQDFGLVYGRTDGVESSNFWRAGVRGDYLLSDRYALYGRGGFDRNRFAGISRRFSEGVGAAAKLIATSANEWSAEAGFEATQERNLAGASNSYTSARGATIWKHNFSEFAHFMQMVEVLPNLEESKDLRINTESALVAPISTNVRLMLSYVVRYDNLPALNAAGTAPLRKSDRMFSTGIQIAY